MKVFGFLTAMTILIITHYNNRSLTRGRGTEGQWGHVPPPHFLKSEKVPFFLG
jgi:hypothetical protein